VAAFLLVPIFILSKTLMFAVKVYWDKTHADGSGNSGGIAKVMLPVLLMLGAQSAFAQNAAAAAPVQNPYGYTVWLMLLVIGLEVFAIIILGLQTVKLLKLASGEAEKAAETSTAGVVQKSIFAEIWEKINKFRPIEEEESIDTGHSYDGIRELDNITPPWFTVAFIGTIIFAIIYLWVYHVSGTGLRQEEELARELARAEEQKKAFLATQANNIDENTVTLLTSAADIAAGKKIFEASCAVCHRADLGGQVGPNLTDAYWIHGGSVKDVFKLIKYGAQEKGMLPWKDEYSPQQIAQVASYILSMQGTNPPGAKEPQGELYNPAPEATATEKPAADAAQPQQAGI
jgi:cytochrome c oxidase cbb3-type subunit 3